MSVSKTNAMRLLEAAGIAFSVKEYEVSDGEISGAAVAVKLDQEPERVFKTLVTEGKNTGLNVFVIPVSAELDLKKAAVAVGDKYIKMIKNRDLLPKTGYIHGGCSPFGMKKLYPTFIDETAQLFDTVFVSGGKIGLQVEVAPGDLLKITEAKYCDLRDKR